MKEPMFMDDVSNFMKQLHGRKERSKYAFFTQKEKDFLCR